MLALMESGYPTPQLTTTSLSVIDSHLEELKEKGYPPLFLFWKCKAFQPHTLDIYYIVGPNGMTHHDRDMIDQMARNCEQIVDLD